mmetsp:Transcript_32757/g.80389  ORF Transcript_32757/g.80389 Transcript_32757/m.80389 type:complete len:239 (-) Transcript_32757:246-962(-)
MLGHGSSSLYPEKASSTSLENCKKPFHWSALMLSSFSFDCRYRTNLSICFDSCPGSPWKIACSARMAMSFSTYFFPSGRSTSKQNEWNCWNRSSWAPRRAGSALPGPVTSAMSTPRLAMKSASVKHCSVSHPFKNPSLGSTAKAVDPIFHERKRSSAVCSGVTLRSASPPASSSPSRMNPSIPILCPSLSEYWANKADAEDFFAGCWGVGTALRCAPGDRGARLSVSPWRGWRLAGAD